jgi:hypothetical protein
MLCNGQVCAGKMGDLESPCSKTLIPTVVDHLRLVRKKIVQIYI